MNFFVSYSHLDLEKAECLRIALSEIYDNKITGFLSSDRLLGRNYYLHVENQLRKCDILVFVATPNSVKSSWCSYEIGFINGRGKLTIPVLFNLSREMMPDFSRLLHGADFADRAGMKSGLNRVFAPIKTIDDNEIRRFYELFNDTRMAATVEKNIKNDIAGSLGQEVEALGSLLGKVRELRNYNNDDTFELLLLLLGHDNRHVRMEAVEILKSYFIDRERLDCMLAQFSYVSYAEIQELVEAFSHALKGKEGHWPQYREMLREALSDRSDIIEDMIAKVERTVGLVGK